MFSLRKLLLRQSLVFALLLSIGCFALWLEGRDLLAASQSARQSEAAVRQFKDLRFHVVQVQQFLTDASAVGEADFSDARQHYTAAQALLADLQRQQPGQAAALDAVAARLPSYYQTGEKMALAYIREGRDAGNALMKGAGGFDQEALALTSALDQLSASLEARAAQADGELSGSLHSMVHFGLAVAVAALLLLLGSNLLLGRRLFALLGGEPAHALRMASEVAAGKLHEPKASYPPDSLLGQLERMVVQLADHMRRIHQVSQQISVSSYQISDISNDIVTVNTQQSTQADEVNQISDALLGTADQVKQLSDETLEQVRDALERVENGRAAVARSQQELANIAAQAREAENRFGELSKAGNNIGLIVDTIRRITEQTNILSLNAAIEAARAGEAGRGFAVVADEVRGLAQRTSLAANDIMRIVEHFGGSLCACREAMEAIEHSLAAGLEQSRQSSRCMDVIADSTQATRACAEGIHRVVDEQNRHLGSQTRQLSGLYTTLEQSTSRINITDVISQDLYQVAGQMSALLADFQFDKSGGQAGESDEQRAEPRADNKLVVVLEQGGVCEEGISQNLSLGGMLVRLPQALPDAAAPVQLELRPPQDSLDAYRSQQPIRLSGRIVRQTAEGALTAVAIQFSADPAAREQLKACLNQLGRPVHYA